ncbi:MAG: M23 family metallopeptidase [Chloroflexaceae bacterium]|nr:M23 family metallopeptidase [Chloroflexaceae bacterium]
MDGSSLTLSSSTPPEEIAVQRFLAYGRTWQAWQTLITRFAEIFKREFGDSATDLFGVPALDAAPVPPPVIGAENGFLHLPWEPGVRVVHTAYFDHRYPTVDSGYDGDDVMLNYLGRTNTTYNSHDGHDYYFPDKPFGTRILAASSGIAYARTRGGSRFGGNGVVIIHPNGYETVYWHLDEFAPLLKGVVDKNQGVWVDTGAFIGTSGATGCGGGCDAPHLHFEVRHHGRQVDPYGWYGTGPDPCTAYAGCAASVWLWHASLRGTYDFTPPAERSTRHIPGTGAPGGPATHPQGATPCKLCDAATLATVARPDTTPPPCNPIAQPTRRYADAGALRWAYRAGSGQRLRGG